MKNFDDLKKELLKKPRFKREYDALEPEYALITQIIDKRLKQGLSQQNLAQKVGTKQSAISRLESGNYNPSLFFLKKIAAALGSQVRISL